MQIGICKACQGLNLDKFIQPIILSVLKKQEGLNGFQVVKAIDEYVTFENTTPDPSGVYRYLKAMAEKDLLLQKSDEEGRMIYYITKNGEDCLLNWRETITNYAESLKVLAKQI